MRMVPWFRGAAFALAVACPVTLPNGRGLPRDTPGGNHGNGALATSLWPGGGVVTFKPGGPGCVDEDGALGMKWPWWRGIPGDLSIEGRRLDGEAPPLRAHIPCCYAGPFQSSGLLFPTPGCWEVTGRVGDASLSFVTLVTKVGDGPSADCRKLFGGYVPPGHDRRPR
jgi:hypothetical protein